MGHGKDRTVKKVETKAATARKILVHHVAGVKKASEVRAIFGDLADCWLGTISCPRRLAFTLAPVSRNEGDQDVEKEDE